MLATVEQETTYCYVCDRPTLIARPTPNHLLHGILTLFLCGLWSIPWLLSMAYPEPWRCQTCGNDQFQTPPRDVGSIVLACIIGALAFVVGVAFLVGLARG